MPTNRPYSREEMARLARTTLEPLNGQPALLVHLVALEGVLQTIASMRTAGDPLPPELEQLEALAQRCGQQAYAALREGPYGGLPVA